MEEVTDCAFRRLCYELGAGFTWTEMVRAAALLRRNQSTLRRIDTFDAKCPTGVQLLVSGTNELRKTLEMLEEHALTDQPHWARGIHGIDLNFGCPSPHIINDGLGPAMLSRPQLLRQLFDCLAEWRARSSLPIGAIGAKMRLGLNEDEEKRNVYLKAIQCATGRLDYVVLHPRHARDESTSQARWHHIRKAKELAGHRLAIIGNGDVFSQRDATRMLQQTGCDAVMVARGATKTLGMIFESEERSGREGEVSSRLDSIEVIEGRLSELEQKFQVRPKIAEYHKESVRRAKARRSHQTQKQQWEDFIKWLREETMNKSDKTDELQLTNTATNDTKIASFFHEGVRIGFCSLSPQLEYEYQGYKGVSTFLPFLANLLESKQSLYTPSEAETNPMQLVIGLANGCNIMVLFNKNHIFRLNVWCASCEAPKLVKVN